MRLPTALSKWNFTTKLQWKVCSKCPQVLPPQGQGAKGTVKGARYTCAHTAMETPFFLSRAHISGQYRERADVTSIRNRRKRHKREPSERSGPTPTTLGGASNQYACVYVRYTAGGAGGGEGVRRGFEFLGAGRPTSLVRASECWGPLATLLGSRDLSLTGLPPYLHPTHRPRRRRPPRRHPPRPTTTPSPAAHPRRRSRAPSRARGGRGVRPTRR